jgi:hypothetical protein
MRTLLLLATFTALGFASSTRAEPPTSPPTQSPAPVVGFHDVSVNFSTGGSANVVWTGEVPAGQSSNTVVQVSFSFVIHDTESVADAKRRAIQEAQEKLRLALSSQVLPH